MFVRRIGGVSVFLRNSRSLLGGYAGSSVVVIATASPSESHSAGTPGEHAGKKCQSTKDRIFVICVSGGSLCRAVSWIHNIFASENQQGSESTKVQRAATHVLEGSFGTRVAEQSSSFRTTHFRLSRP
jgi:hypothetical protein